jgi:hypothetical protein
MFALESLSLVGENYSNSSSVRRACDYLVSRQREDGGWGESYKVGSHSFSKCDPANTQLVVLRKGRVDRTRRHSGRANLLGSDGIDVWPVSLR